MVEGIKRNMSVMIERNMYILIIFLLTSIFFSEALLQPDKVLYSPFSDAISQDFEWKFLIHETFQKYHNLPLWDPYVFGGAPFFANHFSKMLYPPNALFLFIDNIGYIITLLVFLHFFAAGITLYYYCKSINLSSFGAFIAAVVYLFSIQITTLPYAGLLNELPFIAFLPLSLLLIELMARKAEMRYAIFNGLVITLMIFGAHTQYTLYALVFIVLYSAFRVWLSHSEGASLAQSKDFMLLMGTSLLIAFMLSAIQLLPSLEMLKYETRSVAGLDYDSATVGSLAPKNMITALIPNFFGSFPRGTYWGDFPFWEFSLYAGIGTLVLALFAFKQRNRFAFFFVAVAATSLFLALGKYNLVYRFLYDTIPFLDMFRSPARIMFFYIFSIAILAGMGSSYITNTGKNLDKKFLRKIVAFLCVVLIFALIVLSCSFIFKGKLIGIGTTILESKYQRNDARLDLRPIEFYKDKIASVLSEIHMGIVAFSVVISAILLMLVLRLRELIKPSKTKIMITSILILDLLLFSMPFINVKDTDLIYTQRDIPSYISKDLDYFRVLDMANALPQHIAAAYGLYQVNGFEPMVLSHYRVYLNSIAGVPFRPSATIPIQDIHHKNLLDLLGVKYIVSNRKLEEAGMKLVYNNTVLIYTNNQWKFFFDDPPEDDIFEFSAKQTNYVYRNDDFLPKAFAVGEYAIHADSQVMSVLTSRDFNPKKIVILEENPHLNQSPGYFKEALIELYSPNKIVVSIETNNPSILVLSEVWYPGWKAYDNGEEVKIYRANHIFRAIPLEKGAHQIEMVMAPASLKIGLLISALAWGGVVVYFLILLRGKWRAADGKKPKAKKSKR